MNWITLLAWVMDPIRTLDELRQAHLALLGHPNMGNRVQVRAPVRNHINAQIATFGGAAMAPWNPGMGAPVVPPVPPVVPPVPIVPVPGPVVPPPPATPLSIVTAALAGATDGVTYTQVLDANGGIAPYTWTALVGLPASLTLNTNGILSGTPATADVGNHGIVIRVTDASGASVDGNFQLSVAAAAPAPVPAPVPPAPAPAPVPAPIVPLAGFRPRKWTYNRMVNRAPEDWLDAELNAWGLPIVGTVDQKREQLHRQMDNSRPWNRVGHDVPVLPGTPPARAPRNIDFSPLGWAAGALGIVALAAALLFLAILPAAAWGWDHSFGSDHSDTKVVINTGNGQNGGNGNNGSNGQNGSNGNGGNVKLSLDDIWTPPTPGTDLGNDGQFDKTTIDLAKEGKWTHRVFNPRLFNAANSWGGADSWFVTLNVGPNVGGSWTSYGNTGEIIYRAKSTQVAWCIAVLTTSKYKAEFLSNTNDPNQVVGFNIKTAPNTLVAVRTKSGELKTGTTSDLGDILVQLPDDGVTTICTAFTSAAPTSESRLHWGPDDRPTEAIDRINAR